MRRRILISDNGNGIPSKQSKAGDLLLYDKAKQKLTIIADADFNIKTYPIAKYSPVGVVVVPGTHNVYKDNSCAVISLNEMDCLSPNNGSTRRDQIIWGDSEVDVTKLNNFTDTCYVGVHGTIKNTVQGVNYQAYLPSDIFSVILNPYDTDTYYVLNDSSYYYHAPSPYNNDDSRNAQYYRTSSPSSTTNTLSDFDGKGNTSILTNLVTIDRDWKTSETLNNVSGNRYPAACCCWRYCPEGTKQGDWYLPAMGELGYIMPKFKKINESIKKLVDSYGIGIQIGTNSRYWSSTERETSYACILYTSHGCASYFDKSYSNYIRAFARIKIE